jgi:hypothetical protein
MSHKFDSRNGHLPRVLPRLETPGTNESAGTEEAPELRLVQLRYRDGTVDEHIIGDDGADFLDSVEDFLDSEVLEPE